MNKIALTRSLTVHLIIFISSFLTNTAFAQVETSTGRSNVTVTSISDTEIKAIQNIRKRINSGDYKGAISRSNRIIRGEDRNNRDGLSHSSFYKEAYNCLCVSLAGMGDTESAMEACNTSIELTPTHWESLKTRATLYYMTQDFPKSLDDFTKSLENAPDDEGIKAALKQNIGVVQSKAQ